MTTERIDSILTWLAERMGERTSRAECWEQFAPASWIENPHARGFYEGGDSPKNAEPVPTSWPFLLEILADPAAVEAAEVLRVEAIRRWHRAMKNSPVTRYPVPYEGWDQSTIWSHGFAGWDAGAGLCHSFPELNFQVKKTYARAMRLRWIPVPYRVDVQTMGADLLGFTSRESARMWAELEKAAKTNPDVLPTGWWQRVEGSFLPGMKENTLGLSFDDAYNPFIPLVQLHDQQFMLGDVDAEHFEAPLIVMPNIELSELLDQMGLDP